MNFWGSDYRYRKRAKKIIDLQAKYQAMGDEELRHQTVLFREQLKNGHALRSLLTEAFAVVCEADFRVLHMRPFPVQILGAVAMEYNNIVEMKTGEGKTLTATMPMYLHGLTGAGNFLITANGYLANRDAEQMGKVYRWLGLSVASGVAQPGHEGEKRDREKIYGADIVYTTNSALGFDYLFDNLAANPKEQYIRHMSYALIDEADAILLDSAQTPLIIAGIPRVHSNYYLAADRMINMLVEKADYKISDDHKSVWFTPEGIARMQHYFGVDDLLGKTWYELYRHLVLALKAHFLYKPDRDYVVDHNEVVLVDRDNGRELIGMKMQSGQHQAIEAKEHVKVTDEMRTMASVTYQNLFRMFEQLAGMTGTAATDAGEFMEVYRLAVYRVPTNEPMIRHDLPDELYISQEAKLLASLKTVREAYKDKRPILIETGSLSLSNLYSRLLLREGIPHSLLNARSASKEAKIVAEAGQLGAVTVATSMAGRGTDIKLGKGVKEKGGLLVLGTERMANRRVDNQLRGRAGRQGEPGSSIFYTSLEDRIVIQNAPKWVRKYTYHHAHDQAQQLSRHGRFRKVIDHAQDRVSNNGRSARFSTLQYGEVFRAQRDSVYATRDQIMVATSLDRVIHGVFKRVADDFAHEHRDGDISEFLDFVYSNIDRDFLPKTLDEHATEWQDPTYMLSLMTRQLEKKHESLTDPMQWLYFQRITLLKTIDMSWIDQVDNLEALQAVTMNRTTNGRDPLFEYQKETRRTFNEMKKHMNVRITRNLLCSDLVFNKDGTIQVQFP
ncbi:MULTISPECIES: accessory Sec system translocase SecA2 [Lacticaseibacillus]|uniref:Protein translocase subunit SecA n=2 Tax=Lacticaseibacillus TaxID=2759736 RepID=A0AAN1C7R6_LACCA|nr:MULTISPECIES: accessory Sec system translocase SecA2 [Lacticaseibacillus]ARY91179.1 accessory Sec system translocase SecA2 [Lacticaseibacillus casei]KAB1969077.1 accessory Sec system translocase SecA2 [Lacticaseibacillus casei]WLV81792.1 accessory Sec system translocase SecA2 [Lacticaseibacillus sp. NCIMB 15473]WNX25743.1 accessory Sec system translocase SecA2 [Lacticaseibacillus casei]WNX28514.1 accessory Sec system translocase SecA2 [Lacticaseibacillus casei]